MILFVLFFSILGMIGVSQALVTALSTLLCGFTVYMCFYHSNRWSNTDQKRTEKEGNKDCPLSRCKLLFALDLRDITPSMSLIDAIQDQCLPFVSSKGLLDHLNTHASSITFLLDGFDEVSWLRDQSLSKQNQFKMLLSGKWLHDSCVIVTTRPHKVSAYIDCFGPNCT